jgi:hypothetical protein
VRAKTRKQTITPDGTQDCSARAALAGAKRPFSFCELNKLQATSFAKVDGVKNLLAEKRIASLRELITM